MSSNNDKKGDRSTSASSSTVESSKGGRGRGQRGGRGRGCYAGRVPTPYNRPSFIDTIPTKNGRELMEKWVSELKDKFLGPNWQRMLSCAYTTQLLHSTGEVCWNNKDSYFIWFEFVY